MDRSIYTVMSGAKFALDRQAVVSQNLSQVGTPGFKALIDAATAVPVSGDATGSRVMVASGDRGFDARPGAIEATGRALDVAVVGEGWLTVQDDLGNEAYTRFGALQVTPEGNLQTLSGRPVVGDGGPIGLPPDAIIEITADGSVLATVAGANPTRTDVVARLKLVNPPLEDIGRGLDGLFRVANGAAAEADPKVRLAPASLEGSNVSVVQAMVDMIGLGRHFETQMSLLKNLEENDAKASQALQL